MPVPLKPSLVEIHLCSYYGSKQVLETKAETFNFLFTSIAWGSARALWPPGQPSLEEPR